jgi:hypothetical protein
MNELLASIERITSEHRDSLQAIDASPDLSEIGRQNRRDIVRSAATVDLDNLEKAANFQADIDRLRKQLEPTEPNDAIGRLIELLEHQEVRRHFEKIDPHDPSHRIPRGS